MAEEALATLGLNIGKHAAGQMAERGITESMIKAALDKGARFIDPKNGTINYVLKEGFASGKDLLSWGQTPLRERSRLSFAEQVLFAHDSFLYLDT